ncbi:MAG: hypothetical protein Q4A61_01395 [Porphyromonadaceae bacterium]|nr:hypothetical protein [Porphyromonadaceae bacterium]
MFPILRLLRSLPVFVLVQIVGLLALLALRPWLMTEAEPDQYIPLLTGLWLAICTLGYLVSYANRVTWTAVRTHLLDWLPELWLTLAIASWTIGLRYQLLMLKGYVILAVVYALYHRRLYRLSSLHWLFVSFVLCSALGLLWGEYTEQGRKVLEVLIALAVLPLSSALMPISPSRLPRISLWLCRLLFSFLTLQIAHYLYLSACYAQHLWDCFSFDKTYLLPLFEGVVHEKMMLWSVVVHPSWWLLFLTLPYMLQWQAWSERKLGARSDELGSDILSLAERVVYGMGLVLFAFITQPRYGLWVAFIALGWFPLQWLIARLPRRLTAASLVALVWAFAFGITWVVDLFQDEERRAMLDKSFAYIQSAWPWGGGLGADTQLQLEEFAHRHSHNGLITMLVDMGLWGGLVWLGLLGGVVWLCLGRARRQNKPFLLFFFLLLLLLLIDSVLYVSITVPLIALYVCLLGSWQERGAAEPLR